MSAPEPVIVSAAVVAGHDGQAELAVDICYSNGATRQTVFPVDALAPVLDAAGVTEVGDLVGRPWSVLLAGRQLHAPNATAPNTSTPNTSSRRTSEEPQPCST